MKLLLMCSLLLSYAPVVQAQSSTACTQYEQQLTQESPEEAIVYQVFRAVGLTQVCAIKLKNGCDDACQCAYTAFVFLENMNPQRTSEIHEIFSIFLMKTMKHCSAKFRNTGRTHYEKVFKNIAGATVSDCARASSIPSYGRRCQDTPWSERSDKYHCTFYPQGDSSKLHRY